MSWPEMRALFAAIFRGRTRAEWASSPPFDGLCHPSSAPRFSHAGKRRPPPSPGEHDEEVLADWGITRCISSLAVGCFEGCRNQDFMFRTPLFEMGGGRLKPTGSELHETGSR